MHDQVKIVELLAGRPKKISREASRGVVENHRNLRQRDGCRRIERSRRAASQDYLLNRVLRLFFFRQSREADCLARQRRTWKDWWLPAPLSHFLYRCKRRRVVHFK